MDYLNLLAEAVNEWLIIFVSQQPVVLFMISNQVICPKTELSVPPTLQPDFSYIELF